MTEIKYIEGAIYQDAHTPEKCMIIVEVKEKWIYTYELNYKKPQSFTNQLVNDKLEDLLKELTLIHFKKNISGVLPFFIDGYLGQIKFELLKELKNDLRTSQILGFV